MSPGARLWVVTLQHVQESMQDQHIRTSRNRERASARGGDICVCTISNALMTATAAAGGVAASHKTSACTMSASVQGRTLLSGTGCRPDQPRGSPQRSAGCCKFCPCVYAVLKLGVWLLHPTTHKVYLLNAHTEKVSGSSSSMYCSTQNYHESDAQWQQQQG